MRRKRTAFFALGVLAACSAVPSTSGGAEAADASPVRSLLEMRREKVVVQEWDLSCGAAALATLFRHQLNDPVSEAEIAKTLIKRDTYLKDPELLRRQQGFSLLDLKRYVDGRGYRGIGYKDLRLDDLNRLAPILVTIDNDGYNHFVVFRGTYGNRVLLADPAWGNRTMLIDQFEATWLEHPGIGKIGFVIANRDGTRPPNRLEIDPSVFPMLK